MGRDGVRPSRGEHIAHRYKLCLVGKKNASLVVVFISCAAARDFSPPGREQLAKPIGSNPFQGGMASVPSHLLIYGTLPGKHLFEARRPTAGQRNISAK